VAKFIALISLEGPIPAGYADQPAPDPADFGLPAEDDAPARTRSWART
jgi:hypothetical protein